MFTIAFTGHRPDKLAGYDMSAPLYGIIRQKLLNELTRYDVQPLEFIFGGALGFDQLAFDIVREFRATAKNTVLLKIAVPFADQATVWNPESQATYYNQLECADSIVYVDTIKEYDTTRVPQGKYSRDKLVSRNHYMVDHANVVISCWNGSSGGTAECVRYAMKRGVTVRNINPFHLK